MLSVNVDEKQADAHVKIMNGGVNAFYPTKTRVDDVREYFYVSLANALCFCPIFGIPAMVMSRQTNKKKRMNNLEGAQKASLITAILNITGCIFGLISLIGFIVAVATHKEK